MNRNIVKILNVKIDALTGKEAIERLGTLMEQKEPSILTTPNTEFIMRAQNDPDFLDIINNKSKMNLADSFGVLWAARFLSWKNPKNKLWRGIVIFFEWFFSLIFLPIFPHLYKNPIPEKLSGSDFIWEIGRFAAKNHYKMFLFGGAPTVAEKAALKMQTDIYDLRVTGVYPGVVAETEKVVEAINKSHANILLVALGAPLQEKWLLTNLKKTNCKVGIGLGGTFDFTAEVIPRAPKFMQKIGLEWFFRLLHQPSRLYRQLAIPRFAWKVLMERYGIARKSRDSSK